MRVAETIFNYDFWNSRLSALNEQYRSAGPFPHIVIDNFLDPVLLDKGLSEFVSFRSNKWVSYSHFNERKWGFSKFEEMPPILKEIIAELNSENFCRFLSILTGVENLFSDDLLEGGGLHESKHRGFLNIHADFVSHPRKPTWRRRANLLVYLNKDWKDEYHGHLEFWANDMKTCVQRIAPVFNRCVVFTTNETSYHGHPEPLNCPDGMSRRSLALYYFTEEGRELKVRSTNYQVRPQDEKKAWLIKLDNILLAGYTAVKRKFGFSDDFAASVLKFFSREKK